ncbi:MAG: PDZ domain-containing protein, partial [Planctomycetaceae bacterium]|nr:PDZ domain-containing protein [Planctomycetaceae bacterium]
RQPFSAGMLQVNLDSEWKGSERGLQLLVRLAEMFDPSSPAGSPRVGLYLIDGHPLKDEDVVVLKAAFGDARVVSRGKVCLGITNDPSRNDATGCRVSEVRRGTSADQGGIQPGDLIVAVDQVRIKDFDHLVELLKDYDIGVVVKMEILREPDLSGRFDAPRGPLFPEFRQLQEPPLEPEKPDNSDDDVKPDDRLRNRRRTLDVKLLGWRSVQSLEDE